MDGTPAEIHTRVELMQFRAPPIQADRPAADA